MTAGAAHIQWMPLRRALRANAAFSMTSGAAVIVARSDLAREFGVDRSVLAALGLMLLSFAVALVWLASRSVPAPGLVHVVVGLDSAWVAATVVVIAGFSDSISARGDVLLVAIAAAVGLLALAQRRRLRLASRPRDQ